MDFRDKVDWDMLEKELTDETIKTIRDGKVRLDEKRDFKELFKRFLEAYTSDNHIIIIVDRNHKDSTGEFASQNPRLMEGMLEQVNIINNRAKQENERHQRAN